MSGRMTRSRHSLMVSKEQEWLRPIASSDEQRQRELDNYNSTHNIEMIAVKTTGTIDVKPVRTMQTPVKPGVSAGVKGVPKVEKRPATTPLSPLLGSRRKKKPKVSALTPKAYVTTRSNSRNKHKLETPTSFKARPVPASSGAKGRGGRAGILKTPKRPLTVARSPNLSTRHRPKSKAHGKGSVHRSASTLRSDRFSPSPMPLGRLQLEADTPDPKTGNYHGNDENYIPLQKSAA